MSKKFYLLVEKDQLPKTEYRNLAMPTKVQLHSVVKGDDRYVPRKRFPWWAMFLIGACGFGLIKLFVSIM